MTEKLVSAGLVDGAAAALDAAAAAAALKPVEVSADVARAVPALAGAGVGGGAAGGGAAVQIAG
jgi:hypothetical protein